MREVFRFFEKAIRTHFSDRPIDEVDAFLRRTFDEKVPLYFILLLTEDRGLMENLFNMQEVFVHALSVDKPRLRDKKYLKYFLDFLNP